MARGKNINKKEALHKMLEAIVKGETDEAAQHLHSYLNVKTREILMGESDHEDEDEKDEDESDEDEKDEKDEKDEDEDEDEEDEKVEEAVTHHPAGAMSRDVKGKVQFKNGGKKTVRKHGNSSAHLDDGIKGKVQFKNGGKNTTRKHGNSAPQLDGKVKGNVYGK